MNPTIITGWISAVLLVFNFGTCLIMPWAKKHFDKECDKSDGKVCEGKACHSASLGSYHKPIVILTIISVIVHIVFSLIA